MFKFALISCLLAAAIALPLTREQQADKLQTSEQQADELQTSEEQADELDRENESVQYSFNSDIQDKINDNMITREETRDGSKVTGMYSYSDGFIMRTVYYEADDDGYRVVNQDMHLIGDGPKFNADGQADIQGSLSGQYSIKLDKGNEPHYKDIHT